MSEMTCEQAMQQFFGYLDRALSGAPLEDMEAHLEQCLDCCDKLAFSRQLDTFIRTRLPDVEPPPGLEARIRDRLAAGRAGAGDGA
jgi:anti-sigma factor (TIGR02949 family)